jgi:hypothetical protein
MGLTRFKNGTRMKRMRQMNHGFFSFVGLDGVAKVQEWYTDDTDVTDEARIFFFCWVGWGLTMLKNGTRMTRM